MPKIKDDLTVEELLPLLAGRKSGVAVENNRGRVIGVASAQDVIEALAQASGQGRIMNGRIDRATSVWFGLLAFMLLLLALRGQANWVIEYPDGWVGCPLLLH